MSTFYLSPSHLGLPLHPTSSSSQPLPPPAFLSHRHSDTARAASTDAGKPDAKLGDRMRDNNGRPRSPVAQPLRHRQLPASFWQEPNVPRGHPGYPFLPHPFHLTHLHALSAGAPSVAGHSKDVSDGSNKQSGHIHKEFLERLQSAQVRGYDLAASRFPITEFLFYNYGLRSYLNPDSASGAESSPLVLTGPLHPADQRLRGSTSLCTSFRPDGAASGKTVVPKLSGAGQRPQGLTPRVPGDVLSGGVGLAFPTLCPYLGYNCPNLHSPHPHRFWNCVLGQAATSSPSSSLSSSVSEVTAGEGVDRLWKPAGGRTVGAYGGRYHPFANV